MVCIDYSIFRYSQTFRSNTCLVVVEKYLLAFKEKRIHSFELALNLCNENQFCCFRVFRAALLLFCK